MRDAKSNRVSTLTSTWQLVGPISADTNNTSSNQPIPRVGYVTGRVTALATTPFITGSTYTIYAGGGNDGVMKSTDRGGTWTPAADLPGGPGVNALAVAPAPPYTVYAWTQDNQGLVYSTDAGASWNLTGTVLAGGTINGLAVDPVTPSTIYAALGGTYTAGLWVSRNSGTTWAKTLGGAFYGGDPCWYPVVDLAVGRASGSAAPTLYAAMVDTGCRGTGIYKSTDSGATWTVLTGLYSALPPGTPDTSLTAVHVTTLPSNPQIVYANVTGPNNTDAVYKSTNGGTTWARRQQSPFADVAHHGHNLRIRVDPTNSNTIHMFGFGSLELYSSQDGGQTYFRTDWCACRDPYTGNDVHADIHALAFGPDGSTLLGGDGGVYRSTDHGTSWSSQSRTLDVNEIYGISLSAAAQPFVVIQGLQDNGSSILTGASTQWNEVQSGDGTYTGVDSTDAGVLYAEQQGGTVIKSSDGGHNWQQLPIPTGTPSFLTYYMTDPNPAFHNRVLYNESDSLFESLDGGASWHLLNNSTNLGSRNYIHSSIAQVAIAPTDENVLYAAEIPTTTGGRVQATTDDGISWGTGTGLPDRSMSSVAVNPQLSTMAWATASGFGSGHVFQSTDAGASWVDQSGNLPDAPADAIVAIRDTGSTNGTALYVGTDVGVYVSTNNGQMWTYVGRAFPHSQLTTIAWREGILYAATYGRGLWSLMAAPALVGHVNWEGRPAQPNALQQLPITLTLKSGATEVNYPVQTTDASGYFTVSVMGMANGAYDWRVKSAQAGASPPEYNPGWLAVTGTLTLAGAPITNVEMGLQRAGDCDNNNLVNSPDFVILKNAFGKSAGQVGYDNRADFTGNHIIGSTDFIQLKNNFGLGGGPPIR